jgi:hypothetical protein
VPERANGDGERERELMQTANHLGDTGVTWSRNHRTINGDAPSDRVVDNPLSVARM